MVKLLLGLDEAPTPHDVADALAVAICHVHNGTGRHRGARSSRTRSHRPAQLAGLSSVKPSRRPLRLTAA